MDRKHSKRRRHNSSAEDDDHVAKKSSKHREEKKRSKQRHDHQDSHHRRTDKNHSRHRREQFDPNIRIKQEMDADNFNQQQRERSQHDTNRRDRRREREANNRDYGLNTTTQPKTEPGADGEAKPEPKQNPSFELSGKLTEDTNTFRGVVIKYNEPPEAMVPKRKWRLYPFKGETALPVLHIHRQSAFLLGRDRKIADIPVDHPSCSKQQAVLQYRAVSFSREDGSSGRRVRPFIIDLDSANGTYLNSEKIETRRYYELKEKDVIKFGFSSREYVILHDNVDLSEVADGMDVDDV